MTRAMAANKRSDKVQRQDILQITGNWVCSFVSRLIPSHPGLPVKGHGGDPDGLSILLDRLVAIVGKSANTHIAGTLR